MNRSFWLLRGLKFVLFAVLFVAVAGYVTMRLWNWLLPDLFNLPLISIWQALGLLVLSRILFGGWGGRKGRGGWARHRREWKQKVEARMAGLTPEEQEKFRQKMAGACGPAWMRRRAADPSQSASL
ncbi:MULTISPECIES: hypothetical protein [Hymenobacter]|uniref:DUF1682 domain-containing protein n=1 Tax=Hymenobacter guriensis TaxID=2793065 RepID=A0ABS0L279_9BACT|nr:MULTISPECIES: hypothetical protein [Hymenobacter]MBG8554210.1 hypothetical protein [Hymenobacter guriensis]MCR5887355.1 hypothetical protein [Hymenobacter sp. J193]